ncbi:hypothetical protein K439DRAFT_1626107 [Ramaria rubella]|nr:hypothetical protein K439DRAFT_1626107 [Ramaria rubella]
MSFAHAPVSKGMMIGLGAASLISSLFDIKPYFHLQLVPHLSRHHQYWRLLSQHLACANSSVLLLMELILYNAGVNIERQFGSVKFASFITVSALVSSTLSFIALLALHRLGVNQFPAGPTSILFSILYQHYRLVPSAYTFQIFALKLSSKSFLYVLAIQCAIAPLPGSAVAAVLGLLTGQLYRADVLGLKSYRIPSSMQNFGTRFLLPFIGSTRAPRRSNQAMPDETTQRADEDLQPITTARPQPVGTPAGTEAIGGNLNANGEPDTPAPGPSVVSQWMNELTGRGVTSGIHVPTEAEINQVASMFPDLPRQSVIGALQRSPNIERAVETLLGGSA